MLIYLRIAASMVIVALWGGLNFLINAPATLPLGSVAGRQFENNDQSYLVTQLWFGAFHGIMTFVTIVFLLIMLGLWWKPMKMILTAIAASFLLTVNAPTADAYYDKTDYAEVYFVLPNESAFYIPDVGANKDSQAQFGSADYLNSNKIAAKRFQIPHTKLPGSAFFSDFYVPAGRLIIVDRTPFSREWVAQAHRGSSNKDESFPCQSSEGLDASVGVAIGASVFEENAAKFLYRFGVKPPVGNRTDPQIIFTSVFYGRSLAEVMDGPVRNKVQSLVCDEFSKLTVDQINNKLATVRTTIETNIKSYLENVGITLDFFGWADTVTFAPQVQDAINRRYTASKEAEIAALLAPQTGTLQAIAQAEATRSIANKWDGKMPTSVSLWWLPSSLTDLMSKMTSPTK